MFVRIRQGFERAYDVDRCWRTMLANWRLEHIYTAHRMTTAIGIVVDAFCKETLVRATERSSNSRTLFRSVRLSVTLHVKDVRWTGNC